MIVYFKFRIAAKVNRTVVDAIASSVSELLAEIIPAKNTADVIEDELSCDRRIKHMQGRLKIIARYV